MAEVTAANTSVKRDGSYVGTLTGDTNHGCLQPHAVRTSMDDTRQTFYERE
eukprot:gene6862-6543_t